MGVAHVQSRSHGLAWVLALLHGWQQRRQEAAIIMALAERRWQKVTNPEDRQLVIYVADGGYSLTFCCDPSQTEEGYGYVLVTPTSYTYYGVDRLGLESGHRVLQRLYEKVDDRNQ